MLGIFEVSKEEAINLSSTNTKLMSELTVSLFVPCFIDQFYPSVAFNTIKVLERAGVSVEYNPEQTCCGQPAYNSGNWEEARKLGIKFISDFGDGNIVVAPGASCIGYFKNQFRQLFKGDDESLLRAEMLAPKMYELTDFLVNVLQKTELGAFFPHKVTYHDACSALREYGIKNEPRQLLADVEGLELIELQDVEMCCGFGGTFWTKFKDISAAMTREKLERAMNTGASFIVSSDSSCLMSMDTYIRKNGLPIRTLHIADILASGANDFWE